jgi:hypothetical protein
MWTELGLDLKGHDALLSVLGGAYTNIFLSQKNRPDGMKYFDFVMSEVHGLRIQELMDAKAQGRKVIGSYCVFVPEELILAVDGVSVGLCAGAEFILKARKRCFPETPARSSNPPSGLNWARSVRTWKPAMLSSVKTPATARKNPMKCSRRWSRIFT